MISQTPGPKCEPDTEGSASSSATMREESKWCEVTWEIGTKSALVREAPASQSYGLMSRLCPPHLGPDVKALIG
ncbi:hypothetical protein NHX12_021546 [Muraenolepis orangiensis]|uniref:Uncharacterized protein n=1 Tax=Muraenolepis orangiensis TaxID=630683 RepID=A0A9Q0IW64_9TELE|nr:hypothetical protein NHX12_021546 [Muraenolepis orangiensis]